MSQQNNINQQEPEVSVVKERFSVLTKLRNSFFTGILVLMPLVLTLWILKAVIFSLDRFMQSFIPLEYIHTLTLHYDNPVFKALTGENTIPGVGLLFGFVVIVFVGVLAKNVLGKKMFEFWDKLFDKTPLIRSVYSAVKQITNTITSQNSSSFREVVLVEYPRKGCWVVAFVSGSTNKKLKNSIVKHAGGEKSEEYLNIFVPTTPNPTSGFLIFLPRKDVIKLNMTVDQGLKLVISAGIITPESLESK